MARQAGIKLASVLTNNRITATVARVAASVDSRPKNKVLKQVSEPDGDAGSDNNSDCRQSDTLADNGPQNLFWLCAESQSNADFLNSLRRRVRHHSVDTHDGQQQCDAGKHSQQDRLKPLLRSGVVEHVLDVSKSDPHLLPWIRTVQSVSNCRDHFVSVALNANEYHRSDFGACQKFLGKRVMEFVLVISVAAVIPDVAGESHDFAFELRGRETSKQNVPSDGILTWKEFFRERLIDDGNAGVFPRVCFCEIPSGQQRDTERHFGDQQRVAKQPRRFGWRTGSAVLFQCAVDVESRSLHGGNESKQNARHDRNENRESQDASINLHIADSVEPEFFDSETRRIQADQLQQVDAPDREYDSGGGPQ